MNQMNWLNHDSSFLVYRELQFALSSDRIAGTTATLWKQVATQSLLTNKNLNWEQNK